MLKLTVRAITAYPHLSRIDRKEDQTWCPVLSPGTMDAFP